MNARRLLPISIVLNLCLLVAAAWLAIRDRGSPRIVSPSHSEPRPVAVASAPGPGTQPVKAEAPKAVQSFDWRLVESEDYKKYIANLRAIGCPEETIRDIISADVKKLFDSRKRSLNASTNKFEYWKAGNFLAGMMNEEKVQQNQELAKEKRALLKELLGVAPEEKPDLFGGMNPFETMLDFLPADKQNEVTEVFQRFQAKMVKGFSKGNPDAEDMKKIQAMQKDMETELGKILSPDELDSYQLRLSQTAMIMRTQLDSFDPSEQEFRDIFKLKKSFDDQFGSFGMMNQDKAERDKYTAAKKDLDNQVKDLLGESRYQDYERAQDYAYQGMYRVADRNGLGKETANKVYDMKKAAEEQAVRLRTDNTLSQEQRTEALKGIRTETENSIRTVFGDKAWQSYRNQPGAHWLKNISPDPNSD